MGEGFRLGRTRDRDCCVYFASSGKADASPRLCPREYLAGRTARQAAFESEVVQDDSEILDDLAAELPSWRNLAVPQQGQFDSEHRRLAKEKLGKLSETSKSLVIYLLHHGKTEATDLMKKCRPKNNSTKLFSRHAERGW